MLYKELYYTLYIYLYTLQCVKKLTLRLYVKIKMYEMKYLQSAVQHDRVK